MNWRGLFSPTSFFPSGTLNVFSWALLLAIPPLIVLLYFLKLKRQPLEVPSTYLWTRTIEDLHVNSIWQRLRQSLLLFLQLLLMALLLLACLRPGWMSSRLDGSRFVFLIDVSASMSATDVAPSRLEKAKELALRYINEMRSGDVAMVISFADSAVVEQSFTDNRWLLRDRVKAIQPTNRPTSIDEALRTASGLANPGSTSNDPTDTQVADPLPATLYVFSDGAFPRAENFILGHLKPVYVPIGGDTTGQESPDNIGVIAFSTERNPEKPNESQAFAQFQNFGDEEVVIEPELYLDGELKDAAPVTIPARGMAGQNFALQDVGEGILKVDVHRKDALAVDNVAYAAINTSQHARVLLVTAGNPPLELALSTGQARQTADVEVRAPDYLESTPQGDGSSYAERALAAYYDLVVFDQCAPKTMPQSNTLFLGAVPPIGGWSIAGEDQFAAVIDWDRHHPITQLLTFDGKEFWRGCTPLTAPQGSTELISAQFGTLMAIAPRSGFEDAVLGVKLLEHKDGASGVSNTNWIIRRGFPVFVMNCVKYLGGNKGSTASQSVKPGTAVIIRAEAGVDHVQVESPAGVRKTLARESQNTFVYNDAVQPGIYNVHEGNRAAPTQQFAVNLFDPHESNLTVKPEFSIEDEDVKGTSALSPVRRESWKWLLMAGIIVLVFEWYVYNRRVYL